MSESSPFIPPQTLKEVSNKLESLIDAQRGTEIAILAAAIVNAMARPVTLDELMNIRQDVVFALYPKVDSLAQSIWEKLHSAKKNIPYE